MAVTAAVVFTAMLVVVLPAGHPVATDVDVAQWMAAHRTGALTSLFTAVSRCGSIVGIVPLSLVIAIVLYRRSKWRAVRWLAVAVVGATLLYLAINFPIGRARPPMGLRVYEDDEWSFPSGHSTQSVAFWIVVATLLAAEAPRRVRAAAYLGAIIVIAATGLSRIYLCAHWTTDVVGGFALGTCWIALVLATRRWLEMTGSIDGP